jgi:hypothetical protein
VVAHDEAGFLPFDSPRRREAAGGHLMIGDWGQLGKNANL